MNMKVTGDTPARMYTIFVVSETEICTAIYVNPTFVLHYSRIVDIQYKNFSFFLLYIYKINFGKVQLGAYLQGTRHNGMDSHKNAVKLVSRRPTSTLRHGNFTQ